MAGVEEIIAQMRSNPRNIRFNDACKVAAEYFGDPRISGSHHIYRTPWAGDPRVNLQRDKSGRAKAYQVRQLLAAVDRADSEE